MKYLLDTNVISELQKSNCDQRVKDFIEKIAPEDIFICALSIGEICYGVERLPAGKKKHDLAIWLYTALYEWFGERIISLDTDTMEEWGRIRAHAGRTMPIADMLIASAAITHHLSLVTRNTKDFDGIEGINIINPWQD